MPNITPNYKLDVTLELHASYLYKLMIQSTQRRHEQRKVIKKRHI